MGLVGLLARAHAVLLQVAVPPLVSGGLKKLRTVAGEIGLGLMQGRFERPRIDRDQQVTPFYVLALAEMNLGDLAVDLRLHRNARVGLNRADGMELQGDGLTHDLGNQHRDGPAHEAAGGVGLGLRASGAERDGENDCGPYPYDTVEAITHSIGGEAMRNARDRRDRMYRHARSAWQAMCGQITSVLASQQPGFCNAAAQPTI